MSSAASLPMSAWPIPRKALAALVAAACLVALTGAAIYLSAVVFLLLNKADPRQAGFASIEDYWHLYADDPILRKKLLLSIGTSGFGLLVALPAAAIAAGGPRRSLHGDARFAN